MNALKLRDREVALGIIKSATAMRSVGGGGGNLHTPNFKGVGGKGSVSDGGFLG